MKNINEYNELSINRSFGYDESPRKIQSKLEKAPTDTWIEFNNTLSYQKMANGRWKRVNTKTGESEGGMTSSSNTIAKEIYRRKRGYK